MSRARSPICSFSNHWSHLIYWYFFYLGSLGQLFCLPSELDSLTNRPTHSGPPLPWLATGRTRCVPRAHGGRRPFWERRPQVRLSIALLEIVIRNGGKGLSIAVSRKVFKLQVDMALRLVQEMAIENMGHITADGPIQREPRLVRPKRPRQ